LIRRSPARPAHGGPDGQRRERGLEGGQDAYREMLEFTARLDAAGVLKASDSVGTRATRVPVREGRPRLQDGPFAEAREMIGGCFLPDCAMLEVALAHAADCPAARWASVGVREVAPCFEP
jgi:hypothetical protein